MLGTHIVSKANRTKKHTYTFQKWTLGGHEQGKVARNSTAWATGNKTNNILAMSLPAPWTFDETPSSLPDLLRKNDEDTAP